MNVLALNCGSSSLKFQVLACTPGAPPARAARLAHGVVGRIGRRATLVFQGAGRPETREEADVADHAAAVSRALAWLEGGPRVEAVGHRVVHGGPRFTSPARIDPEVVAAIQALETLAPLHNVPSLAGIRAARAALGPGVPMVAAFDTAFHATLPEPAARYAIPHDLALRHDIRRYGFHGLAFRSVLARWPEVAGGGDGPPTLVALHLGNGCSAAAIREGRSVETSMGLTPLEGLVMGTRSGDVDPALVTHLARVAGVPPAEVEDWLNHRAGLLGLSGRSADMRDLLERQQDDTRARLAIDVFCHRARKYLGAYLAVLGGAQGVVFSGGIGEHAPEIRARICQGLEWWGLVVDDRLNAAAVGVAGRLSPPDTRLPVFVVPADEERVIAQDTADSLGGGAASTPAPAAHG